MDSPDTIVTDDGDVVPEAAQYMAGLIDSRATMPLIVRKADQVDLGYRFVTRFELTLRHDPLVDFVMTYADAVGATLHTASTDTKYGSTKLTTESRDSIRSILEPSQPYLLAKTAPVQLLLDDVFPRLANGINGREEFLDLLETAEEYRNLVGRANRSQYDMAYFISEWNVQRGSTDE